MAEPRSGAAGARRKFISLPPATWATALAGGWLAAGEARAVAYDVVLAIVRIATEGKAPPTVAAMAAA